jgi:hypothetical protein
VKISVLCYAKVIHFITIPKAKPSKSCHLKQIVAEFGDYIFSTGGHILYCKVCDTKKIHGTTTYRPRQAYTSSANLEQKEICANVTATLFIWS